MTSAVAIIASTTLLLTEKSLTIQIIASLTLVTSAWLLSLTRSMTSTLMLLIMGISFLSVIAWRHYRPRPAWLFAMLSIAAVSVFSFWQHFFSLIGKDATLTGRTKIWAEYADHIIQQPILGYGYGSLPANPSVLMQLEAHNGYIQLAFYTGGIGVFIFLALLGRALLQAMRQTLQPNPPRYAVFFLSYLIAYVAINISEVYTLSRSLLVWPLFVYITLYMSQRNKLSESQIV
jgi:O-antigen ligase